MPSRNYTNTWRLIALAMFVPASLTSLSCSSTEEKSPGSLEAAEILELIKEGQQKNDPHSDVEIGLGQFRVTHTVADDEELLLLVDFRLIAVVSGAKQSQLEAALPAYSNRLRDLVISLVQSTDTEHLTDPSLAYFKSEMIAGINRVLHQRLVKDVVFSDFSVHDAHQAPFPTTATSDKEKSKKSGHSGHGGGHGH